ncbi:MAG: hypothetical protein PHV30_11360 [Candidatus Margulisbacteria bacterium]|nr:hypothetical protein [Candidatus Margulisiibacteriota bacterium]
MLRKKVVSQPHIRAFSRKDLLRQLLEKITPSDYYMLPVSYDRLIINRNDPETIRYFDKARLAGEKYADKLVEFGRKYAMDIDYETVFMIMDFYDSSDQNWMDVMQYLIEGIQKAENHNAIYEIGKAIGDSASPQLAGNIGGNIYNEGDVLLFTKGVLASGRQGYAVSVLGHQYIHVRQLLKLLQKEGFSIDYALGEVKPSFVNFVPGCWPGEQVLAEKEQDDYFFTTLMLLLYAHNDDDKLRILNHMVHLNNADEARLHVLVKKGLKLIREDTGDDTAEIIAGILKGNTLTAKIFKGFRIL